MDAGVAASAVWVGVMLGVVVELSGLHVVYHCVLVRGQFGHAVEAVSVTPVEEGRLCIHADVTVGVSQQRQNAQQHLGQGQRWDPVHPT